MPRNKGDLMSNAICFYTHVHQPYRIGKFSVFDIGKGKSYFDEQKNMEYLGRIVKKSYMPTTNILLEAIRKTDGKFRMAFSITGVVLEQLEKHHPEVIENFRKLVKNGCEVVGENYYHSLAWLHSKEEFEEQVKIHNKKIREVFGVRPTAFRNTELMFNNEMAKFIRERGYEVMLAEGHEKILGRLSPCFVYKAAGSDMKMLFRHYKLSDDIAFRFTHHYLPAETFAEWVSVTPGNVVNLFMDFETFGEHHWEETGIMKFLERLPKEILRRQCFFVTPTQAANEFDPIAEIDVPFLTSWADTERDLSAWTGNSMQNQALRELYSIENIIKKANDAQLIEDWRKLQTSDHFYFMCTKYFSDGDVHKYFNPYETPYEAFINFINAVTDLKRKAEETLKKNIGMFFNAHYLLRDVEYEKGFFCYDGRVFRNLKEFAAGLRNMKDEVYLHHANENKNDFAKWIRDVICDNILADALEKAANRKEARRITKKRVAEIFRDYLRAERSSL